MNLYDLVKECISINTSDRLGLIHKIMSIVTEKYDLGSLEQALLLSFCLLPPEERKKFHPILSLAMEEMKKQSTVNSRLFEL